MNLEKRNHVKKHTRKLPINNIITTDPLKILKEQECFYNKLYKSSSYMVRILLCKRPLFWIAWTCLSFRKKKLRVKANISSEECLRILDNFQNNKTPGNDGIPIEFYRKFWSLISESYVRCANECFERGEMTRSPHKNRLLLHWLRKKEKIAPSLKTGVQYPLLM